MKNYRIKYLIEENLTLEKSEKEEKNKDILEKDNLIAILQNQISELEKKEEKSLQNLEEMNAELNNYTSMIESLNQEIKSLAEAKDNARELGVRMQVMEKEYMEQLSLINSLKTENGFLLSKQTQINER